MSDKKRISARISDKKRISTRIEAEKHEKLKRAAKKNGMSLADFTGRIVKQWLMGRLREDWAVDKKDPQRRRKNLELRQNLIGLQALNGGKEA